MGEGGLGERGINEQFSHSLFCWVTILNNA